jgi:hypothetical protein
MSTGGKKVVWVLGAGFSAGLGGPLLPALLSRTLERDIAVRYPNSGDFTKLHSHAANNIRGLYEHGLSDHRFRSPDSKIHKENLWLHAEEFLDYLDTAAESDGPLAARLKDITSNGLSIRASLPDLQVAARRLIAAECCAFLEGADTRREKWKPFVNWELMLTENDTIISFNYDRAVEILRDARNERTKTSGGLSLSKISVICPSHNIDKAVTQGCCPLLKLHGSVDWQKVTASDGKVMVNAKERTFALTCPGNELAIATPGPSKSREAKAFKSVWDLACDALALADAIVFLGFRFPETDAEPREVLLNAIAGSSRQGHRLFLHIVLGQPGPHSARLEALLRFACRDRVEFGRMPLQGHGVYSVQTHPLFGQDFLAVVHRADLFR